MIAHPAFNNVSDIVAHEPGWTNLMNYERYLFTAITAASRKLTAATEVPTTIRIGPREVITETPSETNSVMNLGLLGLEEV